MRRYPHASGPAWVGANRYQPRPANQLIEIHGRGKAFLLACFTPSGLAAPVVMTWSAAGAESANSKKTACVCVYVCVCVPADFPSLPKRPRTHTLRVAAPYVYSLVGPIQQGNSAAVPSGSVWPDEPACLLATKLPTSFHCLHTPYLPRYRTFACWGRPPLLPRPQPAPVGSACAKRGSPSPSPPLSSSSSPSSTSSFGLLSQDATPSRTRTTGRADSGWSESQFQDPTAGPQAPPLRLPSIPAAGLGRDCK